MITDSKPLDNAPFVSAALNLNRTTSSAASASLLQLEVPPKPHKKPATVHTVLASGCSVSSILMHNLQQHMGVHKMLIAH
jgi:hypothetical protein